MYLPIPPIWQDGLDGYTPRTQNPGRPAGGRRVAFPPVVRHMCAPGPRDWASGMAPGHHPLAHHRTASHAYYHSAHRTGNTGQATQLRYNVTHQVTILFLNGDFVQNHETQETVLSGQGTSASVRQGGRDEDHNPDGCSQKRSHTWRCSHSATGEVPSTQEQPKRRVHGRRRQQTETGVCAQPKSNAGEAGRQHRSDAGAVNHHFGH